MEHISNSGEIEAVMWGVVDEPDEEWMEDDEGTDRPVFNLSDFDEDRSTLLADRTMEIGLQRCHERAALALEAAPAE